MTDNHIITTLRHAWIILMLATELQTLHKRISNHQGTSTHTDTQSLCLCLCLCLYNTKSKLLSVKTSTKSLAYRISKKNSSLIIFKFYLVFFCCLVEYCDKSLHLGLHLHFRSTETVSQSLRMITLLPWFHCIIFFIIN